MVATDQGSKTFTTNLSGLSSGKTYYVQSYVKEYNASTASVEVRRGEVIGFTTWDTNTRRGWMELPRATSGSGYYSGEFYVGSGNSRTRNYSYLYEYSNDTSLWTAYPLYNGVMSTSKSVKGTTWAKNPDIAENKQINCWSASYNVLYGSYTYVENAAGTGEEYYARGHNIPNADRINNDDMQTQTYYATNSTPQIQNTFNSTIWGKLEKDVRSVASATDTVYVVTGAAFHKGNGNENVTRITPKGDPNKTVPVPNYYWKVLLKVKWSGKTITSAKAVGVWIPHAKYDSNDYSSYVTSVDQIEAWTGFDFVANLPGTNDSGIEKTAEENSSWAAFRDF